MTANCVIHVPQVHFLNSGLRLGAYLVVTLHFEPCTFGNIYDTKCPILIFSLYVDAKAGAPFETWFRDLNVKDARLERESVS
jgi:hypothetical protein